MHCKTVVHLYDEYAHGLAAPRTLARIEEHLVVCAACRRAYEQADQIGQLLLAGSEVAHPGGIYFETLNQRVLARLAEAGEAGAPTIADRRTRAGWRQPLWWAGGMAAAALLALSLVGESIQSLPGGTRPPLIEPILARASEPSGDASAPPTVVVSTDKFRRELVLDPRIRPSTLSAERMAEVAALPPTGRSLSQKPVAGQSATAEGRASNAGPGGRRHSENRDESRIQTVALRAETEPARNLTEELAEQIFMIREEMLEEGDDALYQGLRELQQLIDERTAADRTLEALPAVRQVRLFIQAQDALANGRPREAWTLDRRILLIDNTTPLAYRASLQLADLNYTEWADFAEAKRYYGDCQGARAERAFTDTERNHIARQLERLRLHKENQWEALNLLHLVKRAEWPEVQTALRRLTGLEGAGDLLPETARSLVDRMQNANKPPMEIATELYQLLDARAAAEPADSARAWLELALGDMQLVQFQEMQSAVDHYAQAIEAGGDSIAARLATTKRDQLIDRQLLDLLR